MNRIILFFAFIGLSLSTIAQDTIASGICGADGDNLTWVLTTDGVLTISGDGAMADHSIDYEFEYSAYIDQIKTVVIDSGVTTIGYGAFQFGTITSVSIPNSVTNIKENAFAICTHLVSVTIPNSVDTIGRCAFLMCSNLISVIVPDAVTTIEYGTFGSCSRLQSISLGKSIRNIEDRAFDACRSLDTIVCKSTIPPIIDKNPFDKVPRDAIVYIPCNTRAFYLQSTWRNYFTNFVEDCVGVNEIVSNGQLKIYPNPNTGQLTIVMNNEQLTMNNVEIYSVVGQLLQSKIVNQQSKIEIDVSHLAKGVYFLKVGNQVVRFVKE